MNLNFTAEALSDLRAIHTYISESDIATAGRVISRIRQAIEMLGSFPLLGRPGLVEGTRELAVTGLPYTVVYAIASRTDLDVLTIIHQRRQYPPLV